MGFPPISNPNDSALFGGLDRIEIEIGVAIGIPISGMTHPNRPG